MLDILRDNLPQDLIAFLDIELMGNPFWMFLKFAVLLATFFVVFKIAGSISIHNARKLTNITKTDFDDFIINILDDFGNSFYLFLSFFVSYYLTNFTSKVDLVIGYLALIILIFYLLRFTFKLINYFKRKAINRSNNESVMNVLAKIMKGVILVVALLLVLSNFGVDVTSVVAGLGIGGIAVALALQNVLGDLFASISLLLDKPFKEGDFIIIGSDLGFVRKVGIKTTRIESLWGQEIIVSNTELTSTRINNYKRMQKRRIHFSFGVTYETPNVKLRKIKTIVKNIFKKFDDVTFDRVHFKAYGDFGLNYEVAYYVNIADYNRYMDVQEEINLDLKRNFEKENIEFAYPTRRIILDK